MTPLIILDEEIYPRKGIDPRRIGIFAENLRDGFKFEPIEVEPDPNKPGRYRLLDGAHRWSAYKTTGVTEVEAVIKTLDGNDPLLFAAQKAIGPRQLTGDETRATARRVYTRNPSVFQPLSLINADFLKVRKWSFSLFYYFPVTAFCRTDALEYALILQFLYVFFDFPTGYSYDFR